MNTNLLMSVDLGSRFIKTGVYDQVGQCVASSLSLVKSETPSAGVSIQRGEDILRSVIASMKSAGEQLGERTEDVAAVGFTGQMDGFMGVDKEWNDITSWSCSLDSRYVPYVRRQLSELNDEFYTISGTTSPLLAPKIEWFKTEFSREAEIIVKYVTVSSYVLGKLSDISIEEAAIGRSYTQRTGLADVKSGVWSDTLCDAVNINRDYLPQIVGATHICGYLSAEAARLTGFTSGIPLVSGAGDKVASCLGAAAVEPGGMIFQAAKDGLLSCCVDEYRLDMETRRVDIVPSAIPGHYFAMHLIAGSGITLDWFNETFPDAGYTDKFEQFEKIDRLAAGIQPGCDGLMAIGLLAGSAQPLDSTLRGMWIGLDWSHKKEHFYRALLESYSYDLALAAQSIARIYPEYHIDSIKITGGGAKSDVWTQMNADVLGKTYQHLDRKDVALWGAAIMAGSAIGVFPDMAKTAAQHVSVQNEVRPDLRVHQRYKPFISRYKESLVELSSYFREMQKYSSKG